MGVRLLNSPHVSHLPPKSHEIDHVQESMCRELGILARGFRELSRSYSVMFLSRQNLVALSVLKDELQTKIQVLTQCDRAMLMGDV